MLLLMHELGVHVPYTSTLINTTIIIWIILLKLDLLLYFKSTLSLYNYVLTIQQLVDMVIH
jgi:hypothetical protein